MRDWPTIAELEELNRNQLQSLSARVDTEIKRLRQYKKKLARVREKIEVGKSLRRDLDRLRGKYDEQALESAGIPSAEAIGRPGAG